MPAVALPTMPTTRNTPTDLREACVRAAHAFIAEHGVEHLSLREVARRLGVSHQAPYKHYPSRDHLLAEVMRRCFRAFAAHLDARDTQIEPLADLAALGQRYLSYAASHPVEYRLMFGTPWPATAESAGLVDDAVHAFDVLRSVLRRVHGEGAAQRTRVDLDAMFIWTNMHGLASIGHSNVVGHLRLSPAALPQVVPHVMGLMGRALAAPPNPGG